MNLHFHRRCRSTPDPLFGRPVPPAITRSKIRSWCLRAGSYLRKNICAVLLFAFAWTCQLRLDVTRRHRFWVEEKGWAINNWSDVRRAGSVVPDGDVEIKLDHLHQVFLGPSTFHASYFIIFHLHSGPGYPYPRSVLYTKRRLIDVPFFNHTIAYNPKIISAI